jgi:hypothetical protein
MRACVIAIGHDGEAELVITIAQQGGCIARHAAAVRDVALAVTPG